MSIACWQFFGGGRNGSVGRLHRGMGLDVSGLRGAQPRAHPQSGPPRDGCARPAARPTGGAPDRRRARPRTRTRTGCPRPAGRGGFCAVSTGPVRLLPPQVLRPDAPVDPGTERRGFVPRHVLATGRPLTGLAGRQYVLTDGSWWPKRTAPRGRPRRRPAVARRRTARSRRGPRRVRWRYARPSRGRTSP